MLADRRPVLAHYGAGPRAFRIGTGQSGHGTGHARYWSWSSQVLVLATRSSVQARCGWIEEHPGSGVAHRGWVSAHCGNNGGQPMTETCPMGSGIGSEATAPGHGASGTGQCASLTGHRRRRVARGRRRVARRSRKVDRRRWRLDSGLWMVDRRLRMVVAGLRNPGRSPPRVVLRLGKVIDGPRGVVPTGR